MNETPETKKPEKKSGKGTSVFTYLAILFAAAFLMLLLAYFIQQRNNAVAIDGLKDSLSTSSHSMEELVEENKTLRNEVTTAQQELDAVKEQLEELQGLLDESAARIAELEEEEQAAADIMEDKDLIAQVESWANFYEVTRLYESGDYNACADYIIILSGSTYYATPAEGYDRMVAIYDELVEKGCLNPEDMMFDIIHYQP